MEHTMKNIFYCKTTHPTIRALHESHFKLNAVGKLKKKKRHGKQSLLKQQPSVYIHIRLLSK